MWDARFNDCDFQAGEIMKSRSDYEFEIIAYHKAIQDDPCNAAEYARKRDKLVPNWMETLPVTVFIASNEQLPWDIESIGFSSCPMPTKNDTTPQQTGDYQYWIETPGRDVMSCFGPLLVERKSLSDFYGTMFGNRDRFKDEIERYYDDSRFNQMIVVIEADITEWREYKPHVSRAYDETRRTRTVTVDQKDAAIASLLARGVIPCFAGSRERAPMFYRHLVRQNIIKNWDRWILPKDERVEA